MAGPMIICAFSKPFHYRSAYCICDTKVIYAGIHTKIHTFTHYIITSVQLHTTSQYWKKWKKKWCLKFLACIEALGTESGAITDGQLTASSEWNSKHAPSLARLNLVKEGNKAGSWSAKTNDVNQWLQIELGSEYSKVTQIATQGRSDYDQWVKAYKLQYSDDGLNFQYYREQGETEDKVVP